MSFYLFFIAALVVLGTLLSPTLFVLLLVAMAALALVTSTVCRSSNKLPWQKLLISALALSYGFGWLHWQLAHRLPIAQDKQEVTLKLSVIDSMPQQSLQRLLVKVVSAEQEPSSQSLPSLRKLNLSYYKSEPVIHPGAVINADIVLRSPRNIANGLAFDYEAWLISKGIDASGYIKKLEVSSQGASSLRNRFIAQQQEQHPNAAWPWIAGLVFGEQSSFTAEQWQLAKQTGTLHLLVVSGLHMGLVLLLLVFVWRTLLRFVSLALGRSLPSLMVWQLLFLLVGSAGYLWLAGSGVALQRAWLMFSAVLILQSSRLKLDWLTAITFALLLVVLINPLIWTGPGFAYSFSAVLSLLLFFSARKSNVLEAAWLPQWVIFLALMPVFIAWQQPVSLIQLIANMLAIPYVSLVLLPLSLLNLFITSAPLVTVLDQAGQLFWCLLEVLSVIPLYKVIYLPLLSLLLWPLWLWLIRRGVSYILALLLTVAMTAIVFVYPAVQKPVAMMIDVGQGQSLAFTTERHSLVYDSGPFMGQFDTGDAVITPVLHRLGVSKIDNLIISHNDNDHAGGTAALLSNFAVLEWWGGQPVKNTPDTINLCSHSSERWQVLSSKLLYRYLNVDDEAWLRLPDNNNNRSCVVQLDWYGKRFLLTGDIGKPVEYELVRKYGAELSADILVLAHHGSSTSTSEVFLRSVNPQQVWISSGFNNKFNHPAEDVKQRLHAQNIPWLNTAVVGAIVLHPNGKVIAARDNWQPPWRQPK